MNSDDCSHLVNVITATWPTGPKAYVWTQTIARLDASLATQAYAYLRDHEARITIADYLEQYRRLEVRAAERAAATEATIPDAGLGLPEYLDRLTTRAQRGDEHAARELEAWRTVRGARLATAPDAERERE